MIKVVCTTRNGELNLVRIKGHAAYNIKGFDIVCAGVSSIVEGAQSFLSTEYSKKITISRNRLSTTFSVVEKDNEFLQVCLQMLVHQLRNISWFYPDYVAVHFV